VACLQMGLGTAGTAVGGNALGQGTEPPSKVWLDAVQCTGDEVALQNCFHAEWGVTDCSASESVGVICEDAVPQGKQRTAGQSLALHMFVALFWGCRPLNAGHFMQGGRFPPSCDCKLPLLAVTVRLVSPVGDIKSGRLEVFHAGQW